MTDSPIPHSHLLASIDLGEPIGRFAVSIPLAPDVAALAENPDDRDALVGLAKERLAAELVEQFGHLIEVRIARPIDFAAGFGYAFDDQIEAVLDVGAAGLPGHLFGHRVVADDSIPPDVSMDLGDWSDPS